MLSKHLAAYLLPNLSQAIASFGTVAVLTRYLSTEEYGRFSLIFIIMTIAHYIFLTWAEAAASRFYAAAKEKNIVNNHFKTLLSAYLLNCLFFFIFASIILIFYKTDKTSQMALAAAFGASFMRSLLKIGLETRRMNLEVIRFASIESFHIIIGFLATILLVIGFGFKQDGAFIAILIASSMALIFELPSLLKASKNGNFDKNLYKGYFKFGYPLSIGLILTVILNNGDRFVISSILGDTQVGIYSAGYQVAARILEIVFLWASSATFPLLVNAYEKNDTEEFKKAANNSFAIRLGIGAPVAIGIALVSVPLCEILIGPQMRTEAARIAPFIAFGGLLLGMSDYFSDAFMLSRNIIERTILLLVPTIINIGLNFILLPKMGINGAIIATIIAYIFGLLTLAIRGRKYVKLPVPFKEIGKILIACSLMAAGVSLVPDFGGFVELALKAIIGAIIYGALAIALDFAGIKQHWHKISSKFLGAKNG